MGQMETDGGGEHPDDQSGLNFHRVLQAEAVWGNMLIYFPADGEMRRSIRVSCLRFRTKTQIGLERGGRKNQAYSPNQYRNGNIYLFCAVSPHW